MTAGSDHTLPSKALDQIWTFLAPSSSPPNHAAISLPGSCSTSVEAWHDLNGALSKMNMGGLRVSRPHAPRAAPHPEGEDNHPSFQRLGETAFPFRGVPRR